MSRNAEPMNLWDISQIIGSVFERIKYLVVTALFVCDFDGKVVFNLEG